MSAVTDVQRRARQMRMFRAAFAALTALNALILAADVAAGSLAALLAAAAVAFCVLMIVRNTRLIRSLRLQERELNRPRMTPEDWRQLRELEAELGWELSELPASMAKPAQPARSFAEQAKVVENSVRLTAAGSVSMASLLSGTGTLSAPMTGPGGRWRPLSELLAENRAAGFTAAACDCGGCGEASREFGRQLREQVIASQGIPLAWVTTADGHFAQLARVGRERCIGFCPICSERSKS